MTAPGRLGDVRLVWRVERAYLNTRLWDSLLVAGWEPFGVTEDAKGYLYHLRKLVPELPS